MSEPSACITFRIGDSFPASDPVSRFLTVLAMMSNDLLRLLSWLLERDDSGQHDHEGEWIFSFRLQASALSEASKYLRESVPRWPAISSFVGSLPEDAQEELERVAGATNRKAESYVGDWIESHRNLTFHYSEMHPEKAAAGKEEISNALAAAAEIPSQIRLGGNLISVRSAFADRVAVQWLPDGDDAASTLEIMRERVLDLVRFTERAIHAYLGRPDPARRPVFEH